MNIKKEFNSVLIIGAGAFGTSMGSVVSHNFKNVILKVRSIEKRQCINDERENTKCFPGHKLEDNISAILNWNELDELQKNSIELIIFALPSTSIIPFLKENYEELVYFFKRDIPAVSLTKGIDPVSLELPDDLYLHFFQDYMDLFTFLSGPSFADEIIDKHITAVSLAGKSKNTLENVSKMINTPFFKILTSYDIKGVLLGGSLKNVLAIASGIIQGLGFNHNTRAAMLTRGIAEMLRFGRVFNARPETFYGLSGMGDLILTTTGELSRNKQFGLEIAKGRSPDQILLEDGLLVEGYKTAKAVHLLSEKYDIRAQIFNGTYQTLYENKGPKEVIKKIMETPSKFEF